MSGQEPAEIEAAEIEAVLDRLRTGSDGQLPLAEAALALALRRRPAEGRSRFGWYRAHLGEMAAAVAEAARADPVLEAAGAADVLSDVLARGYGYAGDQATYDDPANADLSRVVDRRRGLPVALGILWIDIARRQGWQAVGLGFPGHFLIRLGIGADRAVVDPFHGGLLRGTESLRDLVKAVRGPGAELEPSDYAAVTDRQVLVRLVANTRLRALRDERHAEALEAVEDLLTLAGDDPMLRRESGLLRARLGQIRGAIADLERFLAGDPPAELRNETALIVQRLRSRLS